MDELTRFVGVLVILAALIAFCGGGVFTVHPGTDQACPTGASPQLPIEGDRLVCVCPEVP